MTREESKKKAEIMLAYAEGKQIQYRDICGRWYDEDNPAFNDTIDNYRIKPEPHYRQFKNTEEVIEAIKEHGGWLKYKGAYCHICVVYNHCCDFNGFSLEYKDAIKNDVKFTDGTPFGKLVEE